MQIILGCTPSGQQGWEELLPTPERVRRKSSSQPPLAPWRDPSQELLEEATEQGLSWE